MPSTTTTSFVDNNNGTGQLVTLTILTNNLDQEIRRVETRDSGTYDNLLAKVDANIDSAESSRDSAQFQVDDANKMISDITPIRDEIQNAINQEED